MTSAKKREKKKQETAPEKASRGLVIQKNELSRNLRYADRFSVLLPAEKKTVLYLVSRINKGDTAFVPVRLKYTELAKIIRFGTRGGRQAAGFRRYVEQLSLKKFWVAGADGSGSFREYTSWIENPKIYEDGTVELCLNRSLAPYLLDAERSPFTMCRFGYIMNLMKKHSIDLYLYFKSIENCGRWETFPECLSGLLGTSSYDRFSDFEERVLAPSVDEINEKTDICVDYDVVRSGRRVESVCFTVRGHKNLLYLQEGAPLPQAGAC